VAQILTSELFLIPNQLKWRT